MLLYLVVAVLFALLVSSVALKIFLGWPLLVGLAMFALLARKKGASARAIQRMVGAGIRKAMIVLRVLLMIGALTAVWLSAGTIPTLVSLGLRLIRPELFLLCAFWFSSALAFLLGTSFGTVNTIGVVLITIARGCGVDLLPVAGAVICGAYFGDRGSPMSSSLALISALTKTSQSNNVRMAIQTALVPFVTASAGFWLLSGSHPMQGASSGIGAELAGAFRLGTVTLLPAAVVLVLCLLGLNVKWAIAGSILCAAAVSLLWQGCGVPALLHCVVFGFSLPASSPIASIIRGGGICSMLSGATVVMLSCMIEAIVSGTGMADGIRALPAPKSRLGVYGRTAAIAAAASVIGCNQTVAIVMTAGLMRTDGQSADADKVLTEDLTIAASLIPTLVPWNIAVFTPISVMGVSGIGYMPYLFFIYAALLWHALRCALVDRRRRSAGQTT